jgi:hypothetical protein
MTKRTLVPQNASAAPEDVVVLLGPPPLLSTEDPQVYHDLLSRVVRVAAPRHMIDWILVRDFVDLTWEIQRIRRYKVMVIERERASQISAIQNQKSMPVMEISLWYEERKPKRLQKKRLISGLNTESGSFRSFEQSLSTYERLERMLASLELKRHMLLRDAQYYREGLAHLLQDVSTDDVIDADSNDAISVAQNV